MSITRRTLLAGAGLGTVGLLLAACTGDPAPAPTTAAPTPLPTAPVDGVPAPASWMRSTWSTDPYAYGARSFLPVGAAPELRAALATPIADRVFLAGEATDQTRPGTVLGAVDAGRSAAEAVIAASWQSERIAVIGAGVAGAVAGRTLADAGHTVTLIEARDRIGGRIHSVEDAEWPMPVQLGSWLSGADEAAALRTQLLSLGLEELTFDTATGWTDAGEAPSIDPEPLRAALASAADAATDVSLVDALDAAGANEDDATLRALLAWVAATTGADPGQASSWYPPTIVEDALAGAQGDVGALVAAATEGIDVSLSSPVVRVAHDDTGVSLRFGTGESLSFDRVIVTVPLGVLQQGGIEFAPVLPFAHRAAIAGLGAGAVETVWLRFDEPFWQTEAEIWHLMGADTRIRTWLNLAPATGEAVLVGLIGGEPAEEYAALEDGPARRAALESLAVIAPAAS